MHRAYLETLSDEELKELRLQLMQEQILDLGAEVDRLKFQVRQLEQKCETEEAA